MPSRVALHLQLSIFFSSKEVCSNLSGPDKTQAVQWILDLNGKSLIAIGSSSSIPGREGLLFDNVLEKKFQIDSCLCFSHLYQR